MDSWGIATENSKPHNMEVVYKDGVVKPTLKKDPADLPDEEPVRWSTVMFDFTQASTIHGLNHITEDTPFKLRRIIWIVLVIVGATLFAYQVVQSVMIYYSFPVTVNVKVNYNKTLQFPAVTICNQNSFRITKSAEHGYYEMLTEAFSNHDHGDTGDEGPHGTIAESKLHKMFENISMADVYNRTSHNIEDMVISCLWDGKPCAPDDIIRSNTDHGACLTFNSGTKTKIKKVTRIGANGGLRLRLNIEQYEYMSGPIEGAGIKLLLHDQDEIPMVRYLGAAIPPGAHALVGLSIMQVKNLKYPYGECRDDKQLKYYDHYTVSACQLDCLQKYLIKTCRCRDVYMGQDRSGKEDTPICTLNEYLTCLMPALESYEISEEDCKCPIPCVEPIFNPSLSHATLSQYDALKILIGNRQLRDRLVEKYNNARETRQRVDSDISSRDRRRLHRFLTITKKMEGTLVHLRDMAEEMARSTKALFGDWEGDYNFHRWGALAMMEYNIKHNYVRGWDVMDERAFRQLTIGFQQFIANVKFMLEDVLKTANSTSARDTGYLDATCRLIARDLTFRQVMTSQLLHNVTTVYECINNGSLLSVYSYTGVPKYDTLYTPLCLENVEVILHQNERTYNLSRKYLGGMLHTLSTLMNVSRDICEGKSHNATLLNHLFENFFYFSTRINYILFIFKDRVVDASLVETRKEIGQFDALTSRLRQRTSEMNVGITDIGSSVTKFIDNEWVYISKAARVATQYLHANNTKKSKLAAVVLTEDLATSMQNLEKVIAGVRARARSLMDRTSLLKYDARLVYRSIMSAKCTKILYSYLREDLERFRSTGTALNSTMIYALEKLFLKVPPSEGEGSRNFSSMPIKKLLQITNADLPGNAEKVDLEIGVFRFRYHFARAIGNTYEIFDKVVQELQEDLREYNNAGKIDAAFLKENIMNVDVFMRELSYEEIEQQKAYKLTNLWSDIGGSLGLFIGASVLTVFELIDVLVHTLLRKSRAKKDHPGESDNLADGHSASPVHQVEQNFSKQ